MIKIYPRYFQIALGICFCIALFVFGSNDISKVIVSCSLLFVNVIVIFWAIKRESYDILVIAFFMLSYSYVPFAHYYLGQAINIRMQAYSDSTVYQTACLCLLFQIVLWANTTIRKAQNIQLSSEKKRGGLIFYSLVVFSLLATILGLRGETILSAGDYGRALASRESSSVFSYAIITITLGYVYAKDRPQQIIIYILAAFYSIKILLLGGRIEAIQLLIALFLIRFRFIWSRNLIIGVAVLGYFLMSLWSVYRADTSVSLFNINSDSIKLTGGDVYYASMRILYLIEQGVLSVPDRLEAFLYYLSSSILPFNMLPSIANLSAYLSQEYSTGGGGLAPVFFFAFGGIPLVIIGALLISWMLNRMYDNKYLYFYGIMIVTTSPRWFAYYPIQPIKFCVYAVLLFKLVEFVSRKTLKNG